MAKIRLVISGGSAKGILEAVGALNAISDRGYDVEIGAGTSAGGIVLGGLASGRSPAQMELLMMSMDFTKYISTGFFSLLRLAAKGNLSDGSKLLSFFESVTEKKKFKDARFDLRITASDFERGQPRVFSKETDPEMPIALAMRITSAFPLGFSAAKYDGRWYKDGGVYQHVPVSAGAREIFPMVVFAMAHEHSEKAEEKWAADVGLLKEAGRTVDLLVDANVHAEIENAPQNAVIAYSDCLGYGTFKFDFTKDEKTRLFKHGYDVMKDAMTKAGM
jgi:NTE family protein